MTFDETFSAFFYKRTAGAALAVLLVASPAVAQVVIGGANQSSGVEMAMPHSEAPAWLMQYATPDIRKKAKADVAREIKADTHEFTHAAKASAPKQEMPMTPRAPLPVKAEKGLMQAPWSPRAQAVGDDDLFPELTKKQQQALMVAPQLGGAKAADTRAQTTLPAVLTPNLMDSMVAVAREEQGAAPAEPASSQQLAADASASGEQYQDEGAYSPHRAGTEGQNTLVAPKDAVAATKKTPRKLFSSDDAQSKDNQHDTAKPSGKLLADINREPVPTPQDKSQEPALPTTPPPTPVPGIASRREDDLMIPDRAPQIDSLQPLEGMDDMDIDNAPPSAMLSAKAVNPEVVVAPAPAPTTGRKLIAALSDDKPTVSAKENLITQSAAAPAPTQTEHFLKAPASAKPAVDEVKVAVAAPEATVEVPEVKVEAPEVTVETPASVPATVSTEDVDIMSMASAPRLLGKASDKVANAAPTPKASPVMKVEAAKPIDDEIKVSVDAPEVKADVAPEVAVKVETPAIADTTPREPIMLATIDHDTMPSTEAIKQKAVVDAQASTNVLTVPDKAAVTPDIAVQSSKIEAAPKPAPVIAKKTAKKIAKPAPVIVAAEPQVTVSVPDAAPEVKVEVPAEPKAPTQTELDSIVTIPDAVPEMVAPVVTVEAPKQDTAPIPLKPAITVEAEQKIIPPVAATSVPLATIAPAAPTPPPVAQVITPPNLRVETPGASATGAPRLRTPRLVPDVPAVIAKDVSVPPVPPEPKALATIAPDTANDTDAPSANKQTIYFSPDVKDLDEASKQQVDNLREELEDKPDLRVQLTAYADAELTVEARRMALARALAIRSRLAKAGIQPARIDVKAVGQKALNDNGVADRVDVVVK